MLPEYLVNCIHKIAKNEQFIDYKIETAAGSSHGDNFLGEMTAVTLSGTRRGQCDEIQSDQLHLICKAPPANEIRQKNFNTSLVFDREIFIYTKMLPAFLQFQREKGLSEIDSFNAFPKVYACESNPTNGTYILIMEDLKSKNFQMFPKDQIITLDHQLLVMQELGKYHAVSFAMKEQQPNVFNEFKALKDAFVQVFAKTTIKTFIPKVIERSIDALHDAEHKKILQHFRATYMNRAMLIKTDSYCNEFGVMVHGDCWNNNFLFQYSNDNKNQLKSICLVDWQLTHYSPPVIDLLYNIFSSTDKPFRDQHYEKLLKTYHSSLSQTTRKLGSDPNRLYTYENLQMQMQKYSDYALLLTPMIIALRVAKANDVFNLDDYAEMLERGEDADILGQFDDETQHEFSRQINGLVTDLVDYGYVKKV